MIEITRYHDNYFHEMTNSINDNGIHELHELVNNCLAFVFGESKKAADTRDKLRDLAIHLEALKDEIECE